MQLSGVVDDVVVVDAVVVDIVVVDVVHALHVAGQMA